MIHELKYYGRIPARGRYWNVHILEDGFSSDPREYAVGLDTRVEWGINRITNPLKRRIIASSLNITFIDPRGLIFSDFNDPLNDLSKYLIRIEDSTCTYRWTGFPKLNTAFHPTSQTMRRPETSLLAYDGLVDLERSDSINSTNLTLHELIRQILCDGILSQPVEYAFGWRPTNLGATGSVVEKIRFTDTSFYYEPQETDETGTPPEVIDRGKQLSDLLNYFDSNVYQTLRGTWRFGQRWLTGRDLSESSRAGARYNHVTDTVSEIDLAGRVMLAPETDSSDFALRERISGIVWKRGLDDWLESLDDIDFIREGGFQTSPSTYWDTISGSFSNTVIGIRLDDGGTEIRQKTLYIAEGVNNHITVDFNYGMEYTPGGSGNHQLTCQIRAVPFDDADDTYYITGTSSNATWTTTPSMIVDPTSRTPDPNGTAAGSITIHNFFFVVDLQDMPVDGYLEFRILGDTGNDFYLHCDDFIGKVGIDSADPFERWQSNFTFSATGEVIEIDVNIKDVRYHVDPTRFANPTIESDVGTALFQTLAGWSGLETAEEYKDIAELVATSLNDQGGETLRFLRTTVPGIVDPSTLLVFKEVEYIPLYVSFVLHTESSFVLALQNLKQVSV